MASYIFNVAPANTTIADASYAQIKQHPEQYFQVSFSFYV